ncbi:hypothetical protein HF086_005965 [Spodoptera exigua]|uniref:Uncharacterized protein n=1 Tax=Spodoptera exigua TaxID=7107 RepID=A0A922M758_SPOEX|nr:hypothetical protein HF086_005965 [Spodoptera exigua]
MNKLAPVYQDEGVGAIVEGYDPRIVDIDIVVEDVEAVIHVNIRVTDEEFHSMVASMNIEQKNIRRSYKTYSHGRN